MQLLEAIFIKPHGIFLKSILKDQDLSYADIEGFIKTISEDLEILWPQMTYVKKRIESHKSRLSNVKWCTCRITLIHLIDCMIQVLPVIQAAVNDSIHKAIFDESDRSSVSGRPLRLSQFAVDPKKIIQKMKQLTNKTGGENKDTEFRFFCDSAELFSSMILICNRWLEAMITAELESEK